MIFVTHLAFRRRWDAEGGQKLPVRMWGYPFTSLAGAGALLAILVTTWWVEGMRVTLISAGPWLGILTAGYWLFARKKAGGAVK
jgi:L-asparagine transporter-like permease